MKEAWVHLEKWSKEMVTTALEHGADAIIAPSGCHEKIKELGRITTVAPDGDLRPGEDVFFEPLHTPDDEARICNLLARVPVVLLDTKQKAPTDSPTALPPVARTWEVIPLENLTACGGRLLVPVHTKEDIDLALTVLEKGVAGVVLHTEEPEALRKLLAHIKASTEKAALRAATVESIRPAGLGDRVCVDTCTLMQEGEGLLVGNSSGFLFLVQAEAKPNPYVAPRPFRVNAGPVHAYVRVAGGRTRYLSELEAGDSVLIVRAGGSCEPATVGRVKIERRPLLLIEASCEEARGTILLQNAETIRLTAPEGEARSVVDLKPGERILVSVERAGRHFGMQVDETIWEK